MGLVTFSRVCVNIFTILFLSFPLFQSISNDLRRQFRCNRGWWHCQFLRKKKNWVKESMLPSSSAFLAMPISKKEDNGFSKNKWIFHHYQHVISDRSILQLNLIKLQNKEVTRHANKLTLNLAFDENVESLDGSVFGQFLGDNEKGFLSAVWTFGKDILIQSFEYFKWMYTSEYLDILIQSFEYFKWMYTSEYLDILM